jgi:hypothetical protein
MEWFEDFFGKWVVKNRWWIIAATIIIAAIASGGVWFTSFTNDNRIFFSGENPQLLALNDAESTEAIMAITQDMDSDGTSLSLESNRRISDHWKISIDAFFVLDSSEEDIIHPLRDDDSVQIELLYYF